MAQEHDLNKTMWTQCITIWYLTHY